MSNNLIILNPIAGGRGGNKLRKRLLDYITKNKIDIDIKFTEYKGHAIELTKSHAPAYDNIFISGGDGTIHEVFNGLDLSVNKKLGIFPIGTGNDFFASLKCDKPDISDLASYYFSSNNHKYKNFDIFELTYENTENEIKSRYIINVFGVGFDAFVAHNMSNFRGFPGVTAYVASVFLSLLKLKYINVTLSVDGAQQIKGDKLLVTFGNSNRSGGGFYLTPYAKIDDGELDIGVIEKIPILKILRTLPKALVNKLHKVPEISFYKMNNCEMELRTPYYAQVDGELITNNLVKASIKKVEHNLSLIC